MSPSLSAVLVIGELRDRAERTLRGLAEQTALEEMEVVIVDTAAGEARELRVPESLDPVWVDGRGLGRGEDRAAGTAAATAPVLALIEDHAVPDPSWAEALIEAHRGPWSVVGYAFRLAEPSNYVSRAGLVSEAGPWLHPAQRRRASTLPASNVSVKAAALRDVSDDPGSFLLLHHTLAGQFEKAGHPMLLEPGAVIAHEYFPSLGPLLAVNYGHNRLLATGRRRRWGWPRRLLWAVGTPLSAPAVRAWRLLRSLSSWSAVRMTLASAPVLCLSFAAAALGESLGYLLGPGSWADRIEAYELETPRALGAGQGG